MHNDISAVQAMADAGYAAKADVQHAVLNDSASPDKDLSQGGAVEGDTSSPGKRGKGLVNADKSVCAALCACNLNGKRQDTINKRMGTLHTMFLTGKL